MKLVVGALFLLGYASAGRPTLSISVKDGKFDGVDGLEPTVSWKGSSSAGDVDLTYGIKASVKATSDVTSLPKSIWGKASTVLSGWGVSARAELKEGKLDTAKVNLGATSDDMGLSLGLEGSAGAKNSVKSVEITKKFDVAGGSVSVNPRYSVEGEEADVVVEYKNDDTKVELTASAEDQELYVAQEIGDSTKVEVVASLDSQEVTITQKLDDDNAIAPTVNSDGDIAIEWKRNLGDAKSVTTILKPNDSIDVEWKDNEWTANVNIPIDGTDITGTNVSIKRDVTF